LGAIVVIAADDDADALSLGETRANNAAQVAISIAAVSCLTVTTVVRLDNSSWLRWGRWLIPGSRSWVGSNAGDGDGKNGDQASELHVDWIWGEKKSLEVI